MWNIALHSSRTQFPVRSVKVRTITPQILLLAMQREHDATELDLLLAELAATSGDLPVLSGDRLDFGDEADDEPTMPFVALAFAPA